MAAPLIGVIAAKTVAQTLARFGFSVVTDDDALQAARLISDAMAEHGPFRLVVADNADVAPIAEWVAASAASVRLAVIPTPSGSGILDGAPQRLRVDGTLNDLFAVLGYASTDRPEGAQPVEGDEPTAFPEPEPIPEPELEVEPAPEPVAALPTPTEDDFPEDLFVTNAAPAPVLAPVQVEVEEPVEAPEPELVAEPVEFEAPDLGYTPVPVALPEPAYEPVAPTPAPAPEPAYTPSPAAAVDDDFFARRVEAHGSAPVAPARVGKGQVIIVGSGKGGVGKSTTSILLADAAARTGLRVVLVDGNRGQADVRKYLRLGENAGLPTVYDVAAGVDPSAAVVSPAQYGPLRQAARLDVPDFAIVLGPPADLADPRYASPEVYGRIVDHARQIADLVVVDTQIVEAHRTDLWDAFILPLLRSGAWLVGITDESSPGVSNLMDRLTELSAAGVSAASTLILATRYEDFGQEDALYFQNRFGRLGTFIGATGHDDSFRDQMNMGRIIHDSPAVAPAIRAILNRITGRSDLFSEQPQSTKRRLFGRK